MTTGAIRACLCLCLCAFGLALSAQDGAVADKPPAEVAALAERHQRSRTLRGSFSWLVRPILGPVDPARRARSGDFAFAVPASYNIVVRDGADGPVDRWCSDGKARWEVSRLSPGDPADVRGPLAVDGGDADYRRVIACLRLDLDQLVRDHIPTWRGQERVLELRPREKDAGARGPQVAAIAIQLGPEGDPQRVDIDHTDGNRWAVEVTRLERDVALPPELFSPPLAQPR
ncbi:MAG: hypothetical protein L6R48_00265 [Planctomycetes bacterium]|nr:hypothetical protein [Planctomycetota bacterium]